MYTLSKDFVWKCFIGDNVLLDCVQLLLLLELLPFQLALVLIVVFLLSKVCLVRPTIWNLRNIWDNMKLAHWVWRHRGHSWELTFY